MIELFVFYWSSGALRAFVHFKKFWYNFYEKYKKPPKNQLHKKFLEMVHKPMPLGHLITFRLNLIEEFDTAAKVLYLSFVREGNEL